MTNGKKLLSGLMAATALTSLASQGALAQTAANIAAANLLSNFSLLNNTAAGQAVLAQNLAGSIAINNNASTALRGQAIVDNTIASLIGGLSNGISVSDGLGTPLNTVFKTQNTVAANFSSTAVSTNFRNLFNQLDTLTVGGDSAFTKNFFANGTKNGNLANPAVGIALPAGGIFNVYDAAYAPLPANANTVGDSRPYAVAPGQIQTFTANDFFGVSTNSATAILPTLNSNASFPSGHTAAGFTESLLLAMMVPERYQALLLRGQNFGNSRVVLGAHYELDVIGARIQTYYALVQALSNNANYTNQTVPGLLGGTVTTTSDFQALFASAQTDLRTLLSTCAGGIAACAATSTATDPLAYSAANKAAFTQMLTYGMTAVGPTNLDAVVPVGAELLIATRFPYLTAAQQRDVLATTEIASGQALDNGSGWARLNLYTAADGYGAFNGTVTVTMNAASGGVNAYDTWRNNIGDYVQPSTGLVTSGSLIKNGTGTLELAGNNTWSGPTTINAGKLIFSGTSNLPGLLTNNSVLSLTNQDGTAGRTLTVGSYTGGAGSTLIVGTNGAVSDTLKITGGVTPGTTTTIILVNAQTGAPASYNPVGSVLVNVNKGQTAAASNFVLSGGPVRNGLFDTNLVFNSDPQWVLVSLPGADAYRLAAVPSAAQSIWFDTAGMWAERQADLRTLFASGGNTTRAYPVWMKVVGEWATRNETQTTASYSSAVTANASYNQTIGGYLAGVDGGFANALTAGDTMLVGLTMGYLNAVQSFGSSSTKATFDGFTTGVSGTYLYKGMFANVAFKADLLNLAVSVPGAAASGNSLSKGNAYTYGFSGDVGYRLDLGTAAYVEPLATLAYARTNIDGLSIGGTGVSFNDEDQLRGRIGVRAGTTLVTTDTYRLSVAASASAWFLLSGTSSATFNSGANAPLLTLNDRIVKNYGDASLSVDYANIVKGWSAYGKGDYKFANSYDAVSVEAGLRYKF